MRREHLAGLTIILTILLAGCTEPAKTDYSGPSETTSANEETSGADDYYRSRPEATTPEGAAYTTYRAHGTIQADAANSGASPAVSSVKFPVPNNATGVIAELRWTGDLSDLDLVISTPAYCPKSDPTVAAAEDVVCYSKYLAKQPMEGAETVDAGTGVLGANSLRIEIGPDDVAGAPCKSECFWSSGARVEVAVNVPYDLRVTVFYWDDAPED